MHELLVVVIANLGWMAIVQSKRIEIRKIKREAIKKSIRSYNEGWNIAVNTYLTEDQAFYRMRGPEDPIQKEQI